MSWPIWIADAFVGLLETRELRGNPAAVMLLDAPRPDAWLQNVAAEFNLSETAFLLKRADGAWDLRWFTPTLEVDLCGHATLASAHVLWQSGRAAEELLNFHTRSGVLGARRIGDEIALDFPIQPVKSAAAPPALIEAVGLRPHSDIVAAYRAADDWLLKVARGRVEALQPNFALLRQLAGPLQMRGVIVTEAAPVGANYDFASRFFAGGAGIDEDPVTGSAHTKLAPFWGELLKKTELVGVQLSPRGGLVKLKWHGGRVEIQGQVGVRVRGEWLENSARPPKARLR